MVLDEGWEDTVSEVVGETVRLDEGWDNTVGELVGETVELDEGWDDTVSVAVIFPFTVLAGFLPPSPPPLVPFGAFA